MFDEIVFYPYLYGKTFIFLLITSFSQYTTICFVSFVYSVFNEHFRSISRTGGDDGIRFSRELRARSSSVANVHRKFALYRFPFESAFVNNELSTLFVTWWRWWDSNPWPPACRAGALPAELHPHKIWFVVFSDYKVSLETKVLKWTSCLCLCLTGASAFS